MNKQGKKKERKNKIMSKRKIKITALHSAVNTGK